MNSPRPILYILYRNRMEDDLDPGRKVTGRAPVNRFPSSGEGSTRGGAV